LWFPHLKGEMWGTHFSGLVEENRQQQVPIQGSFTSFRMTNVWLGSSGVGATEAEGG